VSSLETGLRMKREQVDRALEELLADCEAPGGLGDALRASLFPGGKRLRPVCVLATAELLGKDPRRVMPLACAVELVHSASLVLDDLPAMDAATVRRGKPAVHVAFGESTAVLVAIALLAQAFDLVALAGSRLRLRGGTSARLVSELAEAVGSRGMVGGQYVDLSSSPTTDDLSTIEFIHSRKTGKLFVAAFRLSALALGTDELTLEALTGFGRNLGLAFQITDDILSVTASAEELGKKAEREEAPVNFATLFGLEHARRIAGELVTTAEECLALFGERGGFLRSLARYVLERRR